MAKHGPAEYAERLKLYLEKDGRCTVTNAIGMHCCLEFPEGSPCRPGTGETLLQVGLEGNLTLHHEVGFDPAGTERAALLERLNRANEESLGEVVFSLNDRMLLRCRAVLRMDACSNGSARRVADEIMQRMWRITTMLEVILPDMQPAGMQPGAGQDEALLNTVTDDDWDDDADDECYVDDELIDDIIAWANSLEAPPKEPADADVEEEFYDMLAWAHIRGVEGLSPRQQKLLYDMLGDSVLREEELLQLTVERLSSALPDAKPWEEINLLGEELPWDPAWGNEKIFLRLGEQEDLSTLEGHELMLANRALERQTRRLNIRTTALLRFQKACDALKRNMAEN